MLNAVVTGHNEGPLLASAIKSVLRNVEPLKKQSQVQVTISVYLDAANEQTIQVAKSFSDSVEVVETQFRDVSQVRNLAVERSSGTHIGFLDGDDLWSDNWLSECYAFAISHKATQKYILHPQINFYFGTKEATARIIMEHISTDDSRFDIHNLAIMNYWSALSFAPVGVYRETPFRSSDASLRVGFEDWSFNIETIAKESKHFVLPKTAHFLREKALGSRRRHESTLDSVYFPSNLWTKTRG